MYTRRKKEINHVSAAYFTDIIIHYGFGETKSFPCFFGDTFAFISRGLNRVVAQISNIVAALLWIPY